jgi:hypothetical protein
MTTPDRDPFQPALPLNRELGRLVTVGHLAPDWLCRWCRQHLATTPGGGLICTDCDTTEDQ